MKITAFPYLAELIHPNQAMVLLKNSSPQFGHLTVKSLAPIVSEEFDGNAHHNHCHGRTSRFFLASKKKLHFGQASKGSTNRFSSFRKWWVTAQKLAPNPPYKNLNAYLIASGFTGEPTAPVIGNAGATNKNSYCLSAAQSFASSLRLKISPTVSPILGMTIQCQG